MPKASTKFFCKECGYETSKWLGQCPSCRAWNSMVEEPVKRVQKGKGSSFSAALPRGERTRPLLLGEIPLSLEERLKSGFTELDRVLGGGIVVGSLLLLGGDPGIGKSTLLLELSRNLSAKEGRSVLYVSGEESLRQIKMRAMRLSVGEGELRFLCETNIENIQEAIAETRPELVVIDSIQTMFTEAVSAALGSVSQVRESAAALLRTAKEGGSAIFLVGHVTKDGNVAGPKILEHMVDAVLYFEGESSGNLRILHGQKNRFGASGEIAVFEMSGEGLQEVRNPSELLLSGRPLGASGSVVSCGMEGTRPLLLEIQGLSVPTSFGLPRRTANGIDFNRLNLLLAVIERRLGIEMSRYDAYVNITGGLRIQEPSLDLAVILALISSCRNLAVPEDVLIFGEVGLAGEVRAVSRAEQRIQEALRLGFRRIVMPAYHSDKARELAGNSAEIIAVKNIREALTILRK